MKRSIETTATNNRIGWIDIAKGIGIILVVVGHLLPADSKLRVFIYTFHMPLFFMLSGLVYSVPSTSTSKFGKLTVIYYFYSLVFLLADSIIRVCLLGNYKATAIIWEMYQTVTFYGINVLWFISTLILCKVFCRFILLHTNKAISLLIAILLYILSTLISQIYTMGTESVSIIRLAIYFPIAAILRACCVMIYFLLGYVIKDFVFCISKKINKVMLFVLGFCLLLLIFAMCDLCGKVDIHTNTYSNPYISLCFGVSGSCAVFMISPFLDGIVLINDLLKFLGKNSVLFMVLHEYLFVSKITEVLLRSVSCFNIVSHICVTILATLVLVRVIYRKIDSCTNKIGDLINNAIKMR